MERGYKQIWLRSDKPKLVGYLGISGTLITLVPNKKKTAMEIYICIYKKREREREKQNGFKYNWCYSTVCWGLAQSHRKRTYSSHEHSAL